MQSNKLSTWIGTLAIGLSLTLATSLAVPCEARADHDPGYFRGVTIDATGVHLDFGRGHHYRSAEYPGARRYFASNRHYRKAQKYERRRQEWLERMNRALLQGRYNQARAAFDQVVHFDKRRQRQLARLDRDRARWAQRNQQRYRRNAHQRRHRHGRH